MKVLRLKFDGIIREIGYGNQAEKRCEWMAVMKKKVWVFFKGGFCVSLFETRRNFAKLEETKPKNIASVLFQLQ